MKIKVSNVNAPNWRDVNVTSQIPAELENLSELAKNIWWSWNFEAIELFKSLDPALWKEVGQNPVLLLERMSYAKLEALAQDKVILKRMNDVYSKFRLYMDVEPDKNRPSVAYFSMLFGWVALHFILRHFQSLNKAFPGHPRLDDFIYES